MRVLAVEDDPSMRTAIGRLLGAAGHDCATFASAEALLESVEWERADCVVTDLNLPAMSGLELLDELRRREHDRLPVIVITAFDRPGLRERALQRGAAAYLRKPFEGSVLLDAIRDLGSAGRMD